VAFDGSNNVIAKKVIATDLQLSGGTSNYYVVQQDELTAKITQRSIIVTDASGKRKTFDGTRTAEIEGLDWQVLMNPVSNPEFVQISATTMAGDSIAPTYTATFADINVGQNKSIALTFTGLTGTDGANYRLLTKTRAGLTAEINKADLTFTVSAQREYDATPLIANSVLQLAPSITDPKLANAIFSWSASTFDDKNVGQNKVVTVGGINLTNAGSLDLSNFNVFSGNATATGSGEITQRNIQVSGITAQDKQYDGSRAAQVSSQGVQFAGLFNGDVVSIASVNGTFASKDVQFNSNSEAVQQRVDLSATYGGIDAQNYNFVPQASTTAKITPRVLTLTGMSDFAKVYDGNTSATVDLTNAALSTIVSGENVSFISSSPAAQCHL
jgi:hypothetical protein